MARSSYVQIDGRLIEVFSDSTNNSIQELGEVVDDYADKLSAQPPPAKLYHYTDASGFKGILESGTLWFTDIFSLNDTSELKHGVEVACQFLEKASSRADASPTCREFAQTVSRVLLENVETSANYFVCCFTDNGDDLSQWKGYADDGRGYALGFDAAALEQVFAHSEVDHHSTFPVSYATADMEAMQERLVGLALNIVRKVGDGMGRRLMQRLSVRLSANVIHCSIFFKHPGFSSEKEYRFLKVYRGDLPVENMKTRKRANLQVRYCEYDWKRNSAVSLNHVVIGPAADRKSAIQFVEECKRKFLPVAHAVEVTHSKLPYRSASR